MLRLALSPRWLFWHVLTLGAMATCGWLALWQWQRAGSALGSALNIGYGVQWPVFAIFFGVMWWRFLRLEARNLPVAPEPAPVAQPVATGSSPPAVEAGSSPPAVEAGSSPPAVEARTSPFTARPAAAPPLTADENPQLVAYNRMLRELAEREN